MDLDGPGAPLALLQKSSAALAAGISVTVGRRVGVSVTAFWLFIQLACKVGCPLLQ